MAPASAGSLEGTSGALAGLAAADISGRKRASVRVCENGYGCTHPAWSMNQTKARLISTRSPFISSPQFDFHGNLYGMILSVFDTGRCVRVRM